MKNILAICLLVLSSVLVAQKNYPKDYFSHPLKIPVRLSGTFGELRSNHFHSGVDLKTNQQEGLPIFAPADGYVSRIKVTQYGYGKAIYVTHPNGYTTVYGHLQKYSRDIQEYVKNLQYKKQKYSIGSIYLKPNVFPLKKGEVIGYTGDTGSSGGPHLHYEIRETRTSNPINPMHFGMIAKDTLKPTIKQVMVYALNQNSRVNHLQKNTLLNFKSLGNGKFLAESIQASGEIGFGINVYDKLNEAPNHNGIYSLEMKVNGARYYYHDVETFSFSESKYINLLIDYKHYANFKSRLQQTFKESTNRMRIYEGLVNNGKLFIEKGKNYNVEIIAKDFTGNKTTVVIPIRGVENNVLFIEKDTTNYKVIAAQFNKFDKENVSVAFPKKSFYEDCFLDFSVANDTVKLHEPTIPLDKKFTLTFQTNQLTEQQKKQVYIANITKPKYPYYVSTKRRKDKVFTNQKKLGTYTLLYDDDKPEINPVNFKADQWLSKLDYLKVRIKDKTTGVRSWRATIDNEWILMQFNHKKGILTYDFSDKKLVGNRHVFRISVSDNVGNTETYTAVFFRK